MVLAVNVTTLISAFSTNSHGSHNNSAMFGGPLSIKVNPSFLVTSLMCLSNPAFLQLEVALNRLERAEENAYLFMLVL